jgi:hypothetical protein
MAPRRVLTHSPFDTLEKTFDLLVTGPRPLALDGTWLDGLADRAIPLGAALMAAEAGVVLADLSWRRSLVHDLAASQRLAHLVGLNGFFCSLLGSARTRPAVGSTSGGPNGAAPGSGVRSSAPTATASGPKPTPTSRSSSSTTTAASVSNASPVPDTSVELTFEDSHL